MAQRVRCSPGSSRSARLADRRSRPRFEPSRPTAGDQDRDIRVVGNDEAAAKARADKSNADDTMDLAHRRTHGLDRGCRDLEVVPQAPMTLVEERAKCNKVAASSSEASRSHAPALRHDVARAPSEQLVVERAEVLERRKPEWPDHRGG